MANTKKATTKTIASLENTTTESTPVKSTQLNDYTLVNVKSNVFGQLIYVDTKTQEEVIWENAGDVQQLTIGLLRSMRQTQIKFFKNQWILITGFADENDGKVPVSTIYDNLNVTQFYKVIVDPTDFEMICSWTPEQITQNVAMLTPQARNNLVVALTTYIEEGRLDSVRAIKAFEKALGCELTISE